MLLFVKRQRAENGGWKAARVLAATATLHRALGDSRAYTSTFSLDYSKMFTQRTPMPEQRWLGCWSEARERCAVATFQRGIPFLQESPPNITRPARDLTTANRPEPPLGVTRLGRVIGEALKDSARLMPPFPRYLKMQTAFQASNSPIN